MKVETFWWGAHMYPESDIEWGLMLTLFKDVKDLGGYDRVGPDEPPVEIDYENRRIVISR